MHPEQRAYQPLEVPAVPESTEEPTASSSTDRRQLKLFGAGQHRFSVLSLVFVAFAAVLVATLAAACSVGLRRGFAVTRDHTDQGSATIFLEAATPKAKEDDAREKHHEGKKSPAHHEGALTPKEAPPATHDMGSGTGIGISTGSAEGTWEIVYEGNVHVRSEKNMSSNVIGVKRHGDVVIGQREGEWLSLACEVGYLKIEIDSMPVVKERAQSYTLLSKGSCAEAGKRPVSGIFECEVAAASIGLSDIVATVSVDKSRPQGCFVDWDTEKLWLDANPQNAGNGALGQFQPLCLDEVASRCAGGHPVPTSPTDSDHKGQPADEGFSASLYCFEVLMAENQVEVDLVREEYKQHAGIFACEEWGVFADTSTARLSPDDQTPAVYASRVPGPVLSGNWTMWQNASAMLHVWNTIRDNDRYQQHDFVVKVEPDAVFVAQRLRINLLWYQKHQHLSQNEGVYFRNCVNFKSMEGAIEVYSRPAIQQFFSEQQRCVDTIPNSYGMKEDTFMAECMDVLKMQIKYDWNLLSDYKCGDNPSTCDDKFKVVFHPFKDWGSYAECLRKTGREG